MKIENIYDMDITEIGHFESVRILTEPECYEPDSPDFITGLDLIFSNSVMCIRANGDDDTIIFKIITHDKARNNGQQIHNRIVEELFEKVRSYELGWVWELTNQQGYTDGIQLEYFNKDRNSYSSVIYQFIIVGSTIKIYRLDQIA